MSAYSKPVFDYLKSIGVTYKATYLGTGKPWNGYPKHAYMIGFSRPDKILVTEFYCGNGGKDRKDCGTPSAYDVLTCLQKYDPSSFDQWWHEGLCDGMGAPQALQTYQTVVMEWQKVSSFFTESELSILQELAQ